MLLIGLAGLGCGASHPRRCRRSPRGGKTQTGWRNLLELDVSSENEGSVFSASIMQAPKCCCLSNQQLQSAHLHGRSRDDLIPEQT